METRFTRLLGIRAPVGVELKKDVRPAAEIIDSMVRDAEAAIARLCGA